MDLEQSFKNAMSCWASGVSVVAVRDPRGLSYGLTVSSFSSVSCHSAWGTEPGTIPAPAKAVAVPSRSSAERIPTANTPP